MSYLIPFDEAVDRKCGRLSQKEIAKTGYYRKADMSKAYNELYLNPNIQSRFGGGVSKMKKKPEDVFVRSSSSSTAIGDVLPPVFNARRFNLGTSVGSRNMFSDTGSSEYGELDMSSDSLDRDEYESQLSSNNSYWDRSSILTTSAQEEYLAREHERIEDEDDRVEHERWLQDTALVRAEDQMIADVPRLRNIQDQGHMNMALRTRLWSYEQEPHGRAELLTGLPAVHPSARPVQVFQPAPQLQTLNEAVPENAVPPEDAINQQPRARI